MKLITELNETVNIVTEESSGSKKLFIEGIFLQSGIANKNKRIYPEHIMEKEVARYLKETIEKNKAWGELGHPSGPQINLDRVSHRIVSLVKEGKNYVGKALITDTQMGRDVRGLIESGGSIGVSSRGLGSLRPISGGLNEVMDDFKLATAADIVADPSAPNAFVNGIMEGVEWFHDGTEYRERKINEIKKSIRSASKSQLEEAKVNAFRNFMRFIAEN